MINIISKVRLELKQSIDLEYKKGCSNFFVEEIKVYGVRTPVVRKIAKKYFLEIKNLEKKEILKICEEFLKSGYNEEATIAFAWAYEVRNKYNLEDFFIFEKWVDSYVDNWAKCDDFCGHAFGYFLLKHPQTFLKIKKWTKSKNSWLRRASAVVMIFPTRKDKSFLEKNFEIADILLLDKEDLVQKGYGWMLKEASNNYQKQVFDYVMRNKKSMPRTALRYAIEKMPKELKIKAMAK